MNKLENACLEKGLRMTEQRRVITAVLSQADDHPDIETLHRRASRVDSNISIATVYRTMRLLEDAGVVARHDFQTGRSRYEQASDDQHGHLIDMRTGDIVEFVSAEIEKLQDEIAEKLGYRLLSYKLELYGVPVTDRKNPGGSGVVESARAGE